PKQLCRQLAGLQKPDQAQHADGREQILTDNGQQHFDNDTGRGGGAVQSVQDHQPNADQLATDAGDGKQASHALAHQGDPGQEYGAGTMLRVLAGHKYTPAQRIQNDRQNMKKRNPEQVPAD